MVGPARAIVSRKCARTCHFALSKPHCLFYNLFSFFLSSSVPVHLQRDGAGERGAEGERVNEVAQLATQDQVHAPHARDREPP